MTGDRDGLDSPMLTCAITNQWIELYKVLKLANLAASGGEAKHRIAAGEVQVNGQVDTRKRRKTRPGDVVSLAGEQVLVMAVDRQDLGGPGENP